MKKKGRKNINYDRDRSVDFLHLRTTCTQLSCYWILRVHMCTSGMLDVRQWFRNTVHGKLVLPIGRAIAEVVSRWLHTTAAQVRSCRICGGQSGTGAGSLRILRFPLPICILPVAPQSSSNIQGWYNRSNIGRSSKWIQSHPMREKRKGPPIGWNADVVHPHWFRENALLWCRYGEFPK
jgi:hypothetical protein